MILTEDLTVNLYEIDKELKVTLRTFQEVLKILYKAYHEDKKVDKRGQLDSIKDLKSLRNALKRYHNYPFIKIIADRIERTYKEYLDATIATREVRKELPNIQQGIDKILGAWKTHNPAKIKLATEFAKKFAENSIKASKRGDILKHSFNPVYHENPLFFGTTRFLEVFETDDIIKAMNLDLDEYRYSYLKIAPNKQTDYQYLAYFILHLQNTPESVKLSSSSLKKYFDMAFEDEKYAELVKLVDAYLRNNKKENLPTIIKRMADFPEINQANENAKKKYNTLYRGIGFSEEDNISTDEIIKQDKKSKYVATSSSWSAAENFAAGRGHLMSKDTRSNDIGYILTYTVNPEAIVLDTRIFGGLFNEYEVVIDTTKANLEDIEEI